MKIEVLVATMFNDDINKLLNDMNIQTDCIIVNQCDVPKEIVNDFEFNGLKVRKIDSNKRGVSNSRNTALKYIFDKNDIIIFTDDDVRFCDDYEKNIIAVYKNSVSDGIVFNVKRLNGQLNKKMSKYLNQINLFRACSVSLTFKAKSVSDFKFDNLFGTGSGVFTLGEENIFVSDLLKNGKKIETNDYIMCQLVDRRKSTWYKGMDKSFLEAKGASFKRMHNIIYFLFIFDFAFRKYKLYKQNISFFQAIKFMFNGSILYKKRCL